MILTDRVANLMCKNYFLNLIEYFRVLMRVYACICMCLCVCMCNYLKIKPITSTNRDSADLFLAYKLSGR